jgi:hypothetical protein
MSEFHDAAVTEFDCVDCGRHIIVLCGPASERCAACISMPGWYLDAEVRAILDPEYRRRLQ